MPSKIKKNFLSKLKKLKNGVRNLAKKTKP